ncbi:MAG: copper chaperone PCu(A)C [Dechloromonas sp.]|jgi:copper(I)-binding protein|nr:copper chaperone PCu(A)C [Candidatus Dechloromonas phosphoritropha]MBP8787218.1 copper chaperone PCu(A)C [Azonexus sp.]MBP9227066.1 copper chaperone PCu(A)C [Azonexus sp.]
MKALHVILTSALLALSTTTAFAGDIEIKAPWVRGTVAGQMATGAFMEVTSKSGATLVGAASPVAGVTEIHEMKMDGGVMKMRAVPRLDLPAGKPVILGPGGYHVMLMNLKQTIKTGDSVPLTLQFEGKDRKVEMIEVAAEVRDLTGKAPVANPHQH